MSRRLGEEVVFCGGCGEEIDPEVCHCGSSGCNPMYDSHSFVPMGCLCGYFVRPASCFSYRDPVVVEGRYFLVEPTPYDENGYVRVREPGSDLVLTFDRGRVRRFS